MASVTVALLAALTAPQMARAEGLLAVISESSPSSQSNPRGDARAWWLTLPSPALTATDAALLQALDAAHVPVIDPRQHPSVRTLSQRIFSQPTLSDANALNMAALLDADALLIGAVVIAPLPPSPNLTQPMTEATLDVRLLSVRAGDVRWTARFSAVAASPDAAVASLLRDLTASLRASAGAPPPTQATPQTPATTTPHEPLLLICDLDRADTLAQIKQRLRDHPAITDVSERWASEGTLALAFSPTPSPDEAAALLPALIESLLNAPFPLFSLQPLPPLDDHPRLGVTLSPR
jgi:hypothetical protein